MKRVQKVFRPGTYQAQFLGLTTPKAGRVRLRFLVLNEAGQDWECVATDKDWKDDNIFANEFVKEHGTNPQGLRNKGFLVKLGHTAWGGPTILCWERREFVLPLWFRNAQDAWQADPAAKKAYIAERFEKDPKFAAANRIRRATWDSLVLGIDNASLLGCDSETLRRHIEKQFEPGWSWKSYPEAFEVDHCQPLSSFDLTDLAEVRKAAHYTNLRPLSVAANRAKYNAPLLKEEKLA